MKIINLDKRQYLSPEAFGHDDTLEAIADTSQGAMQALVVLCADGNGRGSGDLRTVDDIVGTWAGDRIAIVSSQTRSPELSAPGLENIPLVDQIVKTGVDVSDVIISAIVEAEHGWSDLAGLPAERSQRVKFRRLFGRQLSLFVDSKRVINSIEELAAFLNAETEETLHATFVSMAEGVNRLAQEFDLPVRWTFASMSRSADKSRHLIARFKANDDRDAVLELKFATQKLTAAAVLTAFGLEEILVVHGKKVPTSLLPEAIVKIINDTLAGRNLGGMEE